MKTPARRKSATRTPEATRTLVAYQIDEDDMAPIRPAPNERQWMNDADGRFPYRCLPLVMANQYGWEILSTHHFRATWDGTSHADGLIVENLCGNGPLHCDSHFGEGVLTFQLPFLFSSPESWNLMVRGPTNRPKDGIVALDGIVETDWSHATFTMNWRFTRACTVEFQINEPICLFFPILRGMLESFRPEFRMLDSEPELEEKFRQWSQSREQFLSALDKQKPAAVAQAWQKDYLRSAKDKKSIAQPFANEKPWIGRESGDGNHAAPK